jgi:hypothetical protein
MTKGYLQDNLVGPLAADAALFTRSTLGFAGSDGGKRLDRPDAAVKEFKKAFSPIMVETIPTRRVPCGFLSSPGARKWADDRDVRMGLIGLGWWRSSVQSVLGMFDLLTYSSRKVHQHASAYDLIVRCRPDLEFKSPINRDRLYSLASGRPVIGKPDFCNIRGSGGMNDQFFAGRPENILPLMDISNCLPKYSAQGISIQPEVMLGHHLRSLELESVDIPADYIIRRGSGKKVDQRRAKD